MAFFSNGAAYDSQLRRKRSSSTTRERPSRSSTSTSPDGHIRKHSASNSLSDSSTDSNVVSIPPLPAGTSRSTPIAVPPIASTSSDSLSTPLPTTKNFKRNSPPPFSNLMVYAPRNDSPMHHAPSPSSANTHSPLVPSKELPTRSSSLRRTVPLEAKPHKIQTSPAELDQLFPPVLSSSGKSVSPAAKTSSTHKAHSHTNSSSSSSPVTPILFAPSHPSSPGHSPTSHSFSSGQNSSRSSFKRALLSAYNSMEHLSLPGVPSPVSPHMTGKVTPTTESTSPAHTDQSGQKRHRNVLRKPSLHGHRDPISEETDKTNSSMKDSDRNHRPRAKSVTISPTRSGAVFDISQPIPTKALNLTPAGEVVMAYQESQRRFRDISHNSGKLVAVGMPDCDDALRKKSPSSVRATTEDATILETHAHTSILAIKTGLTRKLSAKWGKTNDKREEKFHTMSASITGLPDGMFHSSFSEARTRPRTLKPIDALISPRRRELTLPTEHALNNHEENQGRVWEDTVDDWVINRRNSLQRRDRDKEVEKGGKSPDTDVSNPRRLWKLVKRLSSGNLKERKQSSTEEPPPPVPPLPKDLVGKAAVDLQEDMDMLMTQSPIPETPKGIMRYISSIPSLTIPQPPNVPVATKWPSVSQEANPISSSPRSPTGAGPSRRLRSETTRSSSPSSGTTGFFTRSRSSSTSSYGETLPPMPDMPFTHTILKHGFHGVVAQDLYNERSERRHAYDNNKSPPRRKSHDTSPAGSATIPWFDVHNPINKFLISKGRRQQYPPLVAFQSVGTVDRERGVLLARRPSTANATSPSSPPIIPPRSPKRPSTSTSSISGNANSKKFSVPSVMHAPGASPGLEDDRRSKFRPRSVSDGIVESLPASVTFREMTTLKQPLTEAEKTAKWEDLLNRSAKAGGTLHVVSRTDSPGLWSEKSSS